MTLYIGNGSVDSASSYFRLKNNSDSVVFEQGISSYSGNNFGYYLNSSVPGFIAGSASDPGWVTLGGGWNKINNYSTTTVYNKGNSYNTSTTRFTAPVSGPYLFVWNSYMYQNSYFHPQFAVNGDVTVRRNSTPYRIRGHGKVANYNQDSQMEEVINLIAGDYVEAYCYNGGSTYNYPYYSVFGGVFVG